MPLRIEESFEIAGPADEVWKFISDPRQVVTCLPGADLTDIKDERTYEGRVKVKVGPIVVSYKGVARIDVKDDQARLVSVVADGRETGGSGLAKATITGRLQTAPSGSTQVLVVADVDIRGKVAQFGGGLLLEVARQIFREFADNVQTEIAGRNKSRGEVSLSPVAAPSPSPSNASSIKALPLVLKSIWALLSRLGARLFGRRSP